MFNGMYLESPFTQLPQTMFSSSQTGGAAAGGIADAIQAANPLMAVKRQRGRGVLPNLFASTAGAGGTEAAARLIPRQQQLSDYAANSDWQLKLRNANEQFAQNAAQVLLKNLFGEQQMQQQTARAVLPILNSLFPTF